MQGKSMWFAIVIILLIIGLQRINCLIIEKNINLNLSNTVFQSKIQIEKEFSDLIYNKIFVIKVYTLLLFKIMRNSVLT